MLALAASGCDTATVLHRPRRLSDNGSSYVAGDLARWLEGKGIAHIRGAPNHPQTQGKIERWHQTLKNRVLLENYVLACANPRRSYAPRCGPPIRTGSSPYRRRRRPFQAGVRLCYLQPR